MNTLTTKIILLAAVGASMLAPGAWADERNQKTILTFSSPVEIPGKVLPAGTYVFKLADSPASKQIVQVFNKEESQIYGTFLTIPDYRLQVAEKTIINFHERPAGSPDAIKAWFYPGRNYGHEFVYPKSEARVLAEANHTPVPAISTELAEEMAKPSFELTQPEVQTIISAPLVAETPSGQEVELTEAFPATHADDAVTPDSLPEELPATAGSLPLIGLLGAGALVTSITMRLSARAK